MTHLHKINCVEPWYSKLENGTKEVEGRKGLPKYRSIKAGDKILFYCAEENKQFLATVRRVDSFKSLDEYLTAVTLAKALPGIETMEESRKIYYQWSTEEEIENYGFLGIWININ